MSPQEKYEFNKNKITIKILHNYTCMKCLKSFINSKQRLACHHIIPFRISLNNFLNNMAPLCHSCHNKLEKPLNELETKDMTFDEKCDLYINGYYDFIKETND